MKKFTIFFAMLFFSINLFCSISWDGSESSDWNDGNNWVGGSVPGVGDDVVIPASGVTNWPTLSSNANCRKLTIDGTLNGGSGKLTINGLVGRATKVDNNGTFNYGTSTIVFAPNTYSIRIYDLYEFYNLELASTTDAKKVQYSTSGTIKVHNEFKFTKGVFDLNDNDMEISGNWDNSEELTSGSYVDGGDITMKNGGTLLYPSPTYMDVDAVLAPSSGTVSVAFNNLNARSLKVASGVVSMYDEDEGWLGLILGTASGVVGSLEIESGASLNGGDSEMLVYGAAINTINGTLLFNASGGNPAFSTPFGSIIGSGTINAGNSLISLGGNFSFGGTFNKGTSTVSFVSSGNTTVADNSNFYNLKLDKATNTTLVQTSGKVTFTHTLSYGVNGGYFKGGLRGVVTGSSTYDIPKFLGFTPASSGTVYITKYSGAVPPGGDNACKNFIVVESSTNVALNMVKTYYEDGGDNTEMNGNNSGSCEFWKSTNAGSNWTKVTDGSADDGGNDVITYSGSPSAAASTTTYFAFEDPNNQSLPVEFDEEKFYAVSVEDGVKLSWLTHSEQGLKGFIVYRTTSLDEDFEIIDSWDKNELLRSLNDGGFSSYDTDYVYYDRNVENGKKYYYRIEAYCSEEDRQFHPKEVSVVYNADSLPTVSLDQNYPNPFNNATMIKYSLSQPTRVSLQLYNINGQLVKTLAKGIRKAGTHSLSLTNSDIATGVYYYRLTTPDAKLVRKLILVK